MSNGVKSNMNSDQLINVVIVDTGQLADVVLSTADGGNLLSRGLRGLASERYPDVELSVSTIPSAGFAALRRELDSGDSSLIASSPDIVVLTVADEVSRFYDRGQPSLESIQEIETDLRAIISAIKSKVGAHILVSSISTLDPADMMYTLHGQSEEPFTLQAQRLNLMLVGLSHEEGISIIDVDRIIAEVGGGESVTGPGRYNEKGAVAVLEEIVRILDDYGFMDDRPLMAQIGAAGGKK